MVALMNILLLLMHVLQNMNISLTDFKLQGQTLPDRIGKAISTDLLSFCPSFQEKFHWYHKRECGSKWSPCTYLCIPEKTTKTSILVPGPLT